MLWQCQATQVGDAKGPKMQESQTEMRRQSSKEQGRQQYSRWAKEMSAY
jgi:hypothetical protein